MKYNITEVTWTLFTLAVSHEKKTVLVSYPRRDFY